MIRLTVLFVTLFVVALGCVSLLPTPAHMSDKRSPLAVQLAGEAKADESTSGVRVVYPAPGISDAQNRPVQAASLEAKPLPANNTTAPAPTPDAPVAAIEPQAPDVAAPEAAVAPPTAALAGLNLNTASIEALNELPGVGRIGRTIVAHRPYRSVEDLLTKRVIRRSVYDRIKGQVAAE